MRYLYALHDLKEKRRGMIPIPLADAEDWNKKGYGIFATVNSFHTNRREENNIQKLVSWFVDLDGGNKSIQAQKILNFALVPSLVVETKNGHHVYWDMADQQTVEDYKATLAKLIKQFDSDAAAKDAARVLRVAGFYHMKEPNNPFMVRVIYKSSFKYNAIEMNKHLPAIEYPKEKSLSQIKAISGGDSFWDAVSGLDCLTALQALSGAQEMNGEHFGFESRSKGGHHITINGERRNCFIDEHGKIGPIAGPTIGQWIEYYGHSKAEAAEILKKYFPELKPKQLNIGRS